mmetsp:Transcript_11201/g.31978  ORF Transcript_11201/g.31978 Transcript_11201/m.31978 type:complete len:182 (-) Transcript_11201:413-958(-)
MRHVRNAVLTFWRISLFFQANRQDGSEHMAVHRLCAASDCKCHLPRPSGRISPLPQGHASSVHLGRGADAAQGNSSAKAPAIGVGVSWHLGVGASPKSALRFFRHPRGTGTGSARISGGAGLARGAPLRVFRRSPERHRPATPRASDAAMGGAPPYAPASRPLLRQLWLAAVGVGDAAGGR